MSPDIFIADSIRQVIILALMGLLYYLATAVSIIGVAMMLGGPRWAQEAASFCIGTPFVWLCSGLAQLFAAAVTGLFTGFVWLVENIFAAFVLLVETFFNEVVDPILRGIARVIRFLLVGRR